jgi:hypothetical protein
MLTCEICGKPLWPEPNVADNGQDYFIFKCPDLNCKGTGPTGHVTNEVVNELIDLYMHEGMPFIAFEKIQELGQTTGYWKRELYLLERKPVPFVLNEDQLQVIFKYPQNCIAYRKP